MDYLAQFLADFFSKTLSQIAVIAILAGIGWLSVRFFRKNEFDGLWYGTIFDAEGHVIKTDTFVLGVKGDTVKGHLTRTYPLDQINRNWKFFGKIQNHSFFAVYWSENKRNVSSGCWFLAQVDDNKFDGNYYRNKHVTETSDPTSPITTAHMILTRQPYFSPTITS